MIGKLWDKKLIISIFFSMNILIKPPHLAEVFKTIVQCTPKTIILTFSFFRPPFTLVFSFNEYSYQTIPIDHLYFMYNILLIVLNTYTTVGL